MLDSYQTIAKPSEGIYKEKGSKFIGYAFPVRNDEEIKERMNEVKKEHSQARHHCYAFVVGADKSHYRGGDDGEPSGTAGAPILGQINSAELTNTLIVVVRYFGGTKLGVSGLINAYKSAAEDAIINGKIITKTVDKHYKVTFNYDQTGEVMRIIDSSEARIVHQTFEADCTLEFAIRKSEADMIVEQIKKIRNLDLVYLKTE